MEISRRHLVALPALSAGAIVLGGEAVYAADAYTDLRDRWCDIITGASKVDTSKPEFVAALGRIDRGVDANVALIDRGSNRNRVFTDLPLAHTTDSGRIQSTYTRLRGMAIGWYTPGSRHFHSSTLLADILAGLDTANRVVYYAGRAEFDRFHDRARREALHLRPDDDRDLHPLIVPCSTQVARHPVGTTCTFMRLRQCGQNRGGSRARARSHASCVPGSPQRSQ